MAANEYYHVSPAGPGKYPPPNEYAPYGQEGINYPPTSNQQQQSYYGSQPDHGYQQTSQCVPQKNAYGPPTRQDPYFPHQSPYRPQDYSNTPPPAYNGQLPGHNGPPANHSSHSPDYIASTAPPFNGPQQAYQVQAPPSVETERGWKTNVAVAGGAAFATGALLHHHHQSSSSSSHSGRPAGFFDAIGHKHAHPLARIADPQQQSVCLKLVDKDEGDEYVLRYNPQAGAVYRVEYSDDGRKGEVFRGPLLGSSSKSIGEWETSSSNCLSFEFPKSARRDSKDKRKWGDWQPDQSEWASDIGMLDERWLKWNFVDDARDDREVRFTLTCVDSGNREADAVSKVVMETYYEGSVSIPLNSVRDEEELDEMAVVTFATLDWWRDRLRG